MRIERITEAADVHGAADLFDGPPLPAATERFLADPTHHLLFAYDGADRAIGMISGIKTTHPDKGTEMFIYELGVAPAARLQGVATELVKALADLARRRGCYGMWVGTEPDNAVAQAAAPLHHAIAEDHVWPGVRGYLMVFFAIWWAWMNFTWFASAYDTDDDVYRITTLVQIAGALVLAAGVESAFEESNYVGITFGYVVMRLAMVAQWLRAARNDTQR